MESSEQFLINETFENKGCIVLSEIINKANPIRYECACGVKKQATYNEFITGSCDDCLIKSPPLKKRKISYNNEEFDYKNRCTECNVDMGDCNPRQLCGKTYCLERY
jgi:hypothetical protein